MIGEFILLLMIDIIIKVIIFVSHDSFKKPCASKDEFAWRVVFWIMPCSYLSWLIYELILQFVNYWKNLPPK